MKSKLHPFFIERINHLHAVKAAGDSRDKMNRIAGEDYCNMEKLTHADFMRQFWFTEAVCPQHSIGGYEEGLLITHAPFWYENQEIHFVHDGSMNDTNLATILEGCQQAIDDLNLNFSIKEYPFDNSYKQALLHCKHGTGVDPINLRHYIGSKQRRLEKRCAEILVLDPNRISNKTGSIILHDAWGIGSFQHACAIIWHPSLALAKHEMGHLLGIPGNHKDSKEYYFNGKPELWEEWYFMPPIEGYTGQHDCVMNFHPTQSDFCDQCIDVATSIWQGIEHRTGQKYLK